MLRSRTRAGLVLGGAAALALGGCSLVTPINTMGPYSPATGVRVDLSPEVSLENLLLLTTDAEQPALLIGLAANRSKTEPAEIAVTTEDGTEVYSATLEAEAIENLNDNPVTLTDTEATPGSTVNLTVSGAEAGAQSVPVPVLDGTLEQYAQYLEAADQEATENPERSEPEGESESDGAN